MKILIISYFCLEDTTPRAFRARSLFLSLQKLGHNVDFVSARSSPRSPQKSNKKLHPSSIIRMLRSTTGSLLSKIVPDGKAFFTGLKLLPQLNHRSTDLAITIGLPFTVHLITWFAYKLNILRTKKLIADYGDPFSTNPITKKPFYSRSLERFILKSYDRITIPVASAIPAYRDILVPAEKISIIPQGFNISEDYSRNYKKNPVPTFAYAGALYRKIRDPSAFLEALANTTDEFVFHIYTDFSNTQTINIIEPFYNKLGRRLIVHDKIPRNECLETLSRMDFLVNFSNATQLQAPSKIVDYVLTGRPFLNIQQDFNDLTDFIKFLHGDYTSFKKPDISAFDELNVARDFSQLFYSR